ncbi:MAG: aminoacyl-tRNA hydrolase [Planctomycetaceae bacterium]|nr:aminoacyl-tRNA hydrolase [Planctomycetaceae bacterium]
MKLIVGLGNPGRKYEGTRHNLGFEVVQLLLQRFFGGTPRVKFEAELAEISIGDERVLLLAPQTYMNLSGRSVRQAVEFYKLTPGDLLVVSDDLNLPCGQVRLRGSGSAGGQKGLQNIIDQLGTPQFARLRIGIDRPPGGRDAADYVLQRFSRSERDRIDPAIERAARGVELWVREGLNDAMNAVNAPTDQEI